MGCARHNFFALPNIMHPTSFMSEHTAEYVLVNDLVRRLTPAFPNLVPIFFWATREGNRTAHESMFGQQLRLMTCFARRPKVDHAAPNHLFMKINGELIYYRDVCAPLEIPVLAGLPMVKSLSGLRLNSSCNWFDLAKFDSSDQAEFYVRIASDGTATLGDSSPILQRPLTNPQIEELVSKSPVLSWDRVVDHLRDIRRTVSERRVQDYGYSLPFIGGYKPFFLLVLGNT
jgi:hypothetical protein